MPMAITGQAGSTEELSPNLQPLFQAILDHIPAPKVDLDAPLQMLVTNLSYDDYRGVTALGRIHAGKINAGQNVARITSEGQVLNERARYLYVHQGLEKIEVEHASAGDIVAIAGLEGINIGETLADPKTRSHCLPFR